MPQPIPIINHVFALMEIMEYMQCFFPVHATRSSGVDGAFLVQKRAPCLALRALKSATAKMTVLCTHLSYLLFAFDGESVDDIVVNPTMSLPTFGRIRTLKPARFNGLEQPKPVYVWAVCRT